MSTVSGACQYGATVAPGNLASDLLWLGTQFIAASDLTELLRVNPGLAGQVVQRLTNKGALCASNPPIPAAMTVQDVEAALIDPLVGPILPETYVQKLADLITYSAFKAVCQCNPAPQTCTYDVTVSPGNGLCASTHQPGTYAWPDGGFSSDGGCAAKYAPFTLGCSTALQLTISAVPSMPLPTNGFTLDVYDCVGSIYSGGGADGASYDINMRGGTCAGGAPGLWILIINPEVARTTWHINIVPQGGYTPPPGTTPPASPPPATTTIPTPPPLDCSAATQCSILWNITNRINVDIGRSSTITNLITGNAPVDYVTGQSYQVSGSGEQLLAADTLGVSVSLTTLPSSIASLNSDPPWYYDVGWVTCSTANGWEAKNWLHAPEQRILPRQGTVAGLGYNLATGVVITITELVAPPSTT